MEKTIILLTVVAFIPSILSQCWVLDFQGEIVTTVNIGNATHPMAEDTPLGTFLWNGILSSSMQMVTSPGLNVLNVSIAANTLSIQTGSNFTEQVDKARETFYIDNIVLRCTSDNSLVFLTVIVLFDPVNNRQPVFSTNATSQISVQLPWNIDIPVNRDKEIRVTDEDYLVGGDLNVSVVNNVNFRAEFNADTGIVEIYSKDAIFKNVNLTLSAHDGQHETTLPVSVFTNLFPPKFDQDYYVVSERPTGLAILSRFSAVDPDENLNVRIEYSTADNNISLSQVSGNIYKADFKSRLPRPDELPYIFEITATKVPSNPPTETKAFVILNYSEQVFSTKTIELQTYYISQNEVVAPNFLTADYPILYDSTYFEIVNRNLRAKRQMDGYLFSSKNRVYYLTFEYAGQNAALIIYFYWDEPTTPASAPCDSCCPVFTTPPRCDSCCNDCPTPGPCKERSVLLHPFN